MVVAGRRKVCVRLATGGMGQGPSMASLDDYYRELLQASAVTLTASVADEESLGQVHTFLRDLDTWRETLAPALEMRLLILTSRELQFAAYALVTGLYRQAFGSLRLCFELLLGTVYFSVDRLQLAEWLSGGGDLNWGRIASSETGIFSQRFSEAFFPRLSPMVREYSDTAGTLYRDLSEFVHGNSHTWELTSESIAYQRDLYLQWMRAFKSIAEIGTFSLCLRFLLELDKERSRRLEGPILDRVGHVGEIRGYFASASEQ